MQLINLMIKNYDPLIVVCGDKDAMSVIKHNSSKNIHNLSHANLEISLELQVSFLQIAF